MHRKRRGWGGSLFVVDLWGVSVPIFGIRGGAFPGNRIHNWGVEFIFIERICAWCVDNKGRVVCGTEEFPVCCKWFSFGFHLDLDGIDFLL